MEKMDSTIVFLLLSILSISCIGVDAGRGQQQSDHKKTKLFVFGDSYADTGNWPESSWEEPYGFSFPGHPSGRFSDGLVLTDYIASFLGIRSPVTYHEWRRVGGNSSSSSEGMNFAHGGTGVFNTLVNQPNMTTQISFFQQLLEEEEVNKNGSSSRVDLNSSIALVSVAGNDYATYWVRNGSKQGLPAFTESVVNQLVLNLKRIRELGLKKVAVTAMEPLGCLPQMTASVSYRSCSDPENSLAKFHNQLLHQSVSKLNNNQSHDDETADADSTFVILDLFTAFLTSLDTQPGNTTSVKQLEPCCMGRSREYSCGSRDKNGVKQYVVCENPRNSFFWDSIHPSDHGWFQVYSALKSSLRAL